MPRKAFLKKKSLLDRFKDDYATHTGYIQSARAKHTWNNPLTRRKRTKELNKWIKSFAGKDHIHKLARFNAQQAGRNESYEDVKLDCLRYAGILELPNGVCVKVNATIRCSRRAAFVFRITGIYDAEPENPSKYVIRGFYPVYGLERKPSEEFDIPCNDVSDIEQWVKSNEKGTRMQNETMSLKGFLENLTEKLTKQFDLDLEEVQAYLKSHTQEMQELLDDKELSLKEKVLFVRSEITGEKDEAKKSERLFNKRKMERIALSEGSKVSPYLVEIAHKILTDEYGWKASTIEEVADWLGDHKQAFEHAYGQALRSSDDDKANVKAGIEAALDEEERGVMNAEIAMMGESKKQTNEMIGNKKWVIRIKRLGKNYYVCSSSFRVNKEFRYPSLGGPFVCSDWDITERDIAKYDNYNDAKKAWDSMAQALRGGLPFYKEGEDYEIVQVNFSMMGESKEPADEKLGYEKGHKNSKGEDAPWVIRSHEDNRILASFANKKDAEEHLKRMKQYSKNESLETYACYIDFATEDDAKKGMEIVKGWHPFRTDTAVLIDGLGKGAANHLWNDWKRKCAKAGLAISDEGEVYKEEPACFYGNESKKSESKNLSGYTSDIISELDGVWACGLNGAKRLAEKYADVIQQNYTDGDLSTAETAKFIAGQENLTESNKKTESKQSEVHLELIDTIIVPKWLWEAHTFGNEYGEDLDEHEQEILAKFEEEYGKQYYLDDRSEEADFRSRNDFDEYGGPCYEVDVYKMS